MNKNEFRQRFRELTGHKPLCWQERLFHDCFSANKLPDTIDLPTGLGKTMVMAIWLIARPCNPKLPRRLVYVVDRRTVVDQATDIAERLRDNLEAMPELKKSLGLGECPLPISTLRGQLADNREWSRDPSTIAIIIATVDLVGSALLFSGYRSSFKRRPLEAGLLGQDSLLVLDEAHLSKPFDKLVSSIAQHQQGQGMPIQVIRMSATSEQSKADNVFRLDEKKNSPTCDLKADPHPKSGDERNEVIIRYGAKKRLIKTTAGNLVAAIAGAAGDIVQDRPGRAS